MTLENILSPGSSRRHEWTFAHANLRTARDEFLKLRDGRPLHERRIRMVVQNAPAGNAARHNRATFFSRKLKAFG
jgi:hypothetical protein